MWKQEQLLLFELYGGEWGGNVLNFFSSLWVCLVVAMANKYHHTQLGSGENGNEEVLLCRWKDVERPIVEDY